MLNQNQTMATVGQMEQLRLALEWRYNHFIGTYFPCEPLAELVITTFIGVVYYWILGSLYAIVDFTEWPFFFYQYKIQKTSQAYLTNVGKLCAQVLSNHVFQTALAFALICFKYHFLPIQRTVPTLPRFLLEFLLFNLIREVTFYYSHRWLHHPAIYQYIHKRHHEWQSPFALTAIYSHPIEHFLSNIFPVLVGPILLHSHNLAMYFWLAYVITDTLTAHSGYQFPWSPMMMPIYHDYHHLKFNTNYGIFGLLDWLHGTDTPYRQSPYFKMHRIYYALTPPADLRYDVDKMK